MMAGKYMMHRKIMREIVKASEKYSVPDDIPLEREKLIEIAAQCFATLAAIDFRAAMDYRAALNHGVTPIVEKRLPSDKG